MSSTAQDKRSGRKVGIGPFKGEVSALNVPHARRGSTKGGVGRLATGCSRFRPSRSPEGILPRTQHASRNLRRESVTDPLAPLAFDDRPIVPPRVPHASSQCPPRLCARGTAPGARLRTASERHPRCLTGLCSGVMRGLCLLAHQEDIEFLLYGLHASLEIS